MHVEIIAQGLNDPPCLRPHAHYIDASHLETMTCIVIEAGMASGDPSVMIVSDTGCGKILIQTSLDKFVAAGHVMVAMAETRFGWKQKEGSFTLAPMDKSVRKALLESIKKELEDWDNVD